MIYLSTPYETLTYNISLRYPTIERKLELNTIFQTAMDGGVVSYLTGSTDSTLELDFNELSRQDIIDFIEFLRHAAGQSVRLEIDGVVWKGQILSNPNDATSVGRGLGGNEYYREGSGIKIQFRGSEV